MRTFDLLVATPEAVLYHDYVTSLIVPGSEGSFEVLANHAPLIALVKAGTIEIVDRQLKKHTISIQKGFFEFHKNRGVLLT